MATVKETVTLLVVWILSSHLTQLLPCIDCSISLKWFVFITPKGLVQSSMWSERYRLNLNTLIWSSTTARAETEFGRTIIIYNLVSHSSQYNLSCFLKFYIAFHMLITKNQMYAHYSIIYWLRCIYFFFSVEVKACFTFTAHPEHYSPHISEYHISFPKHACCVLSRWLYSNRSHFCIK